MFWTGFVYLVVAVANVHFEWVDLVFVQIAWLLVLSLPIFVRPLATWLNMSFWGD